MHRAQGQGPQGLGHRGWGRKGLGTRAGAARAEAKGLGHRGAARAGEPQGWPTRSRRCLGGRLILKRREENERRADLEISPQGNLKHASAYGVCSECLTFRDRHLPPSRDRHPPSSRQAHKSPEKKVLKKRQLGCFSFWPGLSHGGCSDFGSEAAMSVGETSKAPRLWMVDKDGG